MTTNPAVTYGFESGNASGWGGSFDVEGSKQISGGPNVWSINPDGNYMGVLTPTGSTNINNAAQALLLNSQDVSYINNTYSNQITNVDYGYTDVHLNAGETIPLKWNYTATDYVPFNDASFATIVNLSNSTLGGGLLNGQAGNVQLLGSTVSGTSNYTTGSYGSTGWQDLTVGASSTGDYRIGFGTFNLMDFQLSPFLMVDYAGNESVQKNGQVFTPVQPDVAPPPPQVAPTPPTNQAPTVTSLVGNSAVQATEDVASTFTLQGADADGNPLTYSIQNGPTNGMVALNGANATYTPNANYNGADSFTFQANDGTVNSAAGTIALNIAAVNDAPTVQSSAFQADEDTTLTFALQGADVDGNPLTYSIQNQPTKGTVSLNGANATYTPNANYNGADSFTFQANDGTVNSSAGTIALTIAAVNDAPTAQSSALQATEDTTQTFALQGSDVDGNPLTYSIQNGPANGTVAINGANATYTPNANYNGADSFTFQANDGTVNSAAGTIALNIAAVNDAPVARNGLSIEFGSGTTVDPLQANNFADDVDGDTRSFVTENAPFASVKNGEIAIDSNYFNDRLPGSGDYKGTLNFTVTDGTVLSNNGTLEVTVKSPVVGSTGSVISPSLASFAAESSDLHNRVVGITGAEVDVDGSSTVQAPVSLKSISDASTVVGDAKSLANVGSLEGITSSHFEAASDLSVASTVQSSVAGSARSTDGIAIANTLIGAQQGIELADSGPIDAFSSGGSSVVSSISSLKASSNAETVGDGTGHSGSLGIDGSWANTIAQEHLGIGTGDLENVLTLDSAADATLNSSMSSNLSATAVAKDGVAVSNAALNSSIAMDNLDVEVGGLGLIEAFNQTSLSSDASSTSNGASAIGINAASAGILDSDFTFSVTDSIITAKDFSVSNVDASTTNGDAWSLLKSSSMGIADLGGSENIITGAGSITAIASDQGFAHSATVSGSAAAFATREAIGMTGYEILNDSDITLNTQALVISETHSSAVGG